MSQIKHYKTRREDRLARRARNRSDSESNLISSPTIPAEAVEVGEVLEDIEVDDMRS